MELMNMFLHLLLCTVRSIPLCQTFLNRLRYDIRPVSIMSYNFMQDLSSFFIFIMVVSKETHAINLDSLLESTRRHLKNQTALCCTPDNKMFCCRAKTNRKMLTISIYLLYVSFYWIIIRS